MKTIEDVKREVRRLDPNLDEKDPGFSAAVILISSLLVGPFADRVARFTRYSRSHVRRIGQRLRQQKIWRGRKLDVEWSDPKVGGIAFWMDVCVARGLMDRVPA